MTQSSTARRGATRFGKSGVLVLVAAVVILSTAFFVAPARAAASAPSSSGAPEQWAFGGNASLSYSCKDANCFNDSTFSGSFSIGYKVSWVVIYTQTNVSTNQTMIEGRAALRASANFAYSQTANGSTVESLSASISGLETATGFTNVTTGTVSLTSASNFTTWTSPALAIMNAASHKAFNFSGTLSVKSPNGTGTLNFDLGGQEASSVAFAPSLGIVPASPQPGDTWSAYAPFTASGVWKSGYSLSVAGAGGAGAESNWTTGSVARSGVLGVNGTDLGSTTLYDNYTSSPTPVQVQVILLDVGMGNFTLSDGYLVIPSNLYAGALSGLSLTGAGGSSGPSNETAYYQTGSGFVGAGIAGSASIPVGAASASPVSLSLRAGPEPVGVAEKQYAAITSPSGSSSGFPWIWVVLVAVIVVVVASVVLISRRSRMRRPPPTAWAPVGAPPSAPSAGPGGGPVPPSPPGL